MDSVTISFPDLERAFAFAGKYIAPKRNRPNRKTSALLRKRSFYPSKNLRAKVAISMTSRNRAIAPFLTKSMVNLLGTISQTCRA